MMRNVTIVIAVSLLAVVSAVGAGAVENSWDLTEVEKIDIDGVSGDIVIVAADGRTGSVELQSDVHPEDSFEPAVSLRGNELRIKEKWHGSSSGRVRWTIYLPKGEEGPSIRISNASGDLECTDVTTRISYKTASGDVELSNVMLEADSRFNTASGDLDISSMTISEDARFSTASGDVLLKDLNIEEDSKFSTASGDILIANCKSGNDVSYSTASGDVEVRNIELTGESAFSSASGDVEVAFDRLPEVDFTASSASGDVTLVVDDFGKDFTLVMVTRKDKGRISCPFDYTDEEEFEKNGQTYVSKIVKRGSGKPVITLETASGKVTVKD